MHTALDLPELFGQVVTFLMKRLSRFLPVDRSKSETRPPRTFFATLLPISSLAKNAKTSRHDQDIVRNVIGSHIENLFQVHKDREIQTLSQEPVLITGLLMRGSVFPGKTNKMSVLSVNVNQQPNPIDQGTKQMNPCAVSISLFLTTCVVTYCCFNALSYSINKYLPNAPILYISRSIGHPVSPVLGQHL